MRRLKAGGLGLLAILLAACQNPQYVVSPTSAPQMGEVRQKIDEVIETTMLHPVRRGAYLKPVEGSYFRPVEPLDSRNALIYVYRPHSKWNAQELQAPGFFLNGMFIYGLKDAGYFWVEVPAGTYTFTAKRPLAIIYLKEIFETKLTVEGGKSYYFRYDEENRVKKSADHPELIAAGPLLQMPDDRGLRQIEGSILEEPGHTLGLDMASQWSPFDLYDNPQPVDLSRIEEDPKPKATGTPASLHGTHRVWWNPLTWDPDRESWF